MLYLTIYMCIGAIICLITVLTSKERQEALKKTFENVEINSLETYLAVMLAVFLGIICAPVALIKTLFIDK